MRFKIITIIIVLFEIFCFSGNVLAKKVMTLFDISEPYILSVNGGKVYVSDLRVKLKIFSIKNFKLVKDVLKKGSGPQECLYSTSFQIYPDYLCTYSIPGKVMFFSPDGIYKNEFRIGLNGVNSFFPVGKNYIAFKNGIKRNNPNAYTKEFSIYTYDNKEVKYKKLFYCVDASPREYEGNKEKTYLIRDYIDFIVYDDKVFLGDTKFGLYVLIFDSNGNQIGKVQLPYERIKIPEHYKTNLIELAKKKYPGDFEIAMQTQIFAFPEYFPPFFRFAVNNGKIYFLTYRFKGDQREVIVADFKGNILKKAYVPIIDMGIDQTFAIDNDKYYYILENEDTEEYELHVADIK